jgi:hypothetical protein
VTELTIHRLSNRLQVADAKGAIAAAHVLKGASLGLSSALDALLSTLLAERGLPPDALVVIPRLTVRLRFQDFIDAESIARSWATAIAAELDAMLEHALEQPASARSGVDLLAVVFQDIWQAEGAILQRLAEGPFVPWLMEIPAELGAPNAEAILSGWIIRDPGRAPVEMLALLRSAPEIARLLSGAAATRLAAQLMTRLTAALPTGAVATDRAPGQRAPFPNLETLLRDAASTSRGAPSSPLTLLPPSLASVLAAMEMPQRLPFLLAGLIVHLPAWTPFLRALWPTLLRASQSGPTGVPSPAGPPGQSTVRIQAPVPSAESPGAPWRQADAGPDKADEPGAEIHAPQAAQPVATGQPEPATEGPVMQAGLLLILRALQARGVLQRLSPAALAGTLEAIGLSAMQWAAAPLPPAARRVILERDRSLLNVFSGRPPPEEPLDAQSPAPEAGAWLSQILEDAPPDVQWAPGALPRAYSGVDPFEQAPSDGLLARILMRPGRLAVTDYSATVTWPLDGVDIALRRAGWDLDPGWLPWIGRTIRFVYTENTALA